jgi:hypothetical protein
MIDRFLNIPNERDFSGLKNKKHEKRIENQ